MKSKFRAGMALLAVCAFSATGCTTSGVLQADPEATYDAGTLGDTTLSAFYEYTASLGGQPGQLLRQENLSERQSLDNAAVNLRLLYSSTDGLSGSGLLPVSGVLYLPEGTAPEGGWPLMAWTHGTVGIADICAPSWNGRQEQDETYLNRFIEQGYAVVASDYQGLGTRGTHPYLATRPAAYSNLDIIRAVKGAGFPVTDKVVLFGQSQGAGAAIATADYAPDYAPEIDLAGVVATGAPYFTPAAIALLQTLRDPAEVDPMLGYTFLAMTLVQQADPAFNMRDYVSDASWPIAKRVKDTCYAELKAMVVAAELTRGGTYTQDTSEALGTGFALMGYPGLDLDAPVFFGTGGRDRDTPPRMQAGLVRDLCRNGTRVQAAFYPELSHRGVVLESTKDSMPFVKAAFAGEPISGTCDNPWFANR